MTPKDVTIIMPDGGVATINLEDTDNIYTEYYQLRLERLVQPHAAPIVLDMEDWDELGAGKSYRRDWAAETTLTMEMILDAVSWLVLGAGINFPPVLRSEIEATADPADKRRYWVTSVTVRHGEHVTTRKSVLEAESEEHAKMCALEDEVQRTEPCEISAMDEQDGGWYSGTWEYHYSHLEATEVSEEEGRILVKHLNINSY